MKILPNGKVENFFWSQGILYKRLSKERVNVATNLEQYTWSNFINYFSQFFQPEKFIFGIKVELLDYFLSFIHKSFHNEASLATLWLMQRSMHCLVNCACA